MFVGTNEQLMNALRAMPVRGGIAGQHIARAAAEEIARLTETLEKATAAPEAEPWGWWLHDLTSSPGSQGFLTRKRERLAIAQPPDEWEVTPLYTHPQNAESLKAHVKCAIDGWSKSQDKQIEALARAEKAEAERDAALARVAELENALAARGNELTAAWHQIAEMEAAVTNAKMYLESGFINCPRCAEEVPTKDTDAEYALRDALTAKTVTIALAARDKAKDDRIAELDAELNRALAQIESLDAECDGLHTVLELMQAERDAALSGAVKVRPLVWEDGNFCGQQASYADTEFGSCMVVAYSGRGGRWAYTDPSGDDSDDDWGSSVDAKAAAQADYEARILAAIQPDQGAVAERLVLNDRYQAIVDQAIRQADKDQRSGLNQRIGPS